LLRGGSLSSKAPSRNRTVDPEGLAGAGFGPRKPKIDSKRLFEFAGPAQEARKAAIRIDNENARTRALQAKNLRILNSAGLNSRRSLLNERSIQARSTHPRPPKAAFDQNLANIL
jgi:hypothetical protein